MACSRESVKKYVYFSRKIDMKSIPLILPLMALPISGQAEKRGNVEMPQCPNVVFIYADDIGYGDLSCNGSKTINTPNVQRMATEGVRFTNAHSAAATSTPSRYAMLTGEYAWRREGTGIADGDAGMIIRPERYTLADMFRDAGYATGVVGKWHLGLGDEKGTQDWNQRLSPLLLRDRKILVLIILILWPLRVIESLVYS